MNSICSICSAPFIRAPALQQFQFGSLPPSGDLHSIKKEPVLLQMPHVYCSSCRSPLHADGHSGCVSCMGKSHADAALAGSDYSHCENISFASLHSWIAFFSESDSAPRALPFSSSQGPVSKKQRGRGSSRSRLDKWFLPGCHQAPRQRPLPFFPEVHEELTRSWCSPYSARLHISASSTLTTVDGAEEKGYEKMPPLDQPLRSAVRKMLPTHPSHKGSLQHSLETPMPNSSLL